PGRTPPVWSLVTPVIVPVVSCAAAATPNVAASSIISPSLRMPCSPLAAELITAVATAELGPSEPDFYLLTFAFSLYPVVLAAVVLLDGAGNRDRVAGHRIRNLVSNRFQVAEVHHDRMPILFTPVREVRPGHRGTDRDVPIGERAAAQPPLQF